MLRRLANQTRAHGRRRGPGADSPEAAGPPGQAQAPSPGLPGAGRPRPTRGVPEAPGPNALTRGRSPRQQHGRRQRQEPHLPAAPGAVTREQRRRPPATTTNPHPPPHTPTPPPRSPPRARPRPRPSAACPRRARASGRPERRRRGTPPAILSVICGRLISPPPFHRCEN